MARCVESYRRFIYESPIAEATGRVMQLKEIRILRLLRESFLDEYAISPPLQVHGVDGPELRSS
jgi:hypothetical protein